MLQTNEAITYCEITIPIWGIFKFKFAGAPTLRELLTQLGKDISLCLSPK